MAIQEGTISGTGAKSAITLGSAFSLSLRDFGTATVVLERSLGGDAWGVVESFTADAEKVGDSNGDLFRLNCTAYASGTISYTLRN
jgi:hypothetical protein